MILLNAIAFGRGDYIFDNKLASQSTWQYLLSGKQENISHITNSKVPNMNHHIDFYRTLI